MKIAASSWDEAGSFLESLGIPGAVFAQAEFRAEAERFLEILLAKNEVLNLTGAKDLETLFWKHLVDSLAVLSVPNLGITADWGCGGGFPGIPLALVRRFSGDETPVYFVDSVGKKVKAVEEFCAALSLSKTQGFVGRGEELLRAQKLKGVNTIVMRAVAPAERAHQWISGASPHWLFLLGPRQREEWERELPKLRKRHFEISEDRGYALPRNLGDRRLLRISKRST